MIVKYPRLDVDMSDDDLKTIAMQVLSTGVVNTINVMRDGVYVDVFNLEEHQRRADENYERHIAAQRATDLANDMERRL